MRVHVTRPGATRSIPDSRQASRTINPSAFWEERAKQQAASANSPRPGQASATAAPAATSSVPAPRSLNPAAIYASRAEQAAAAYARGPQQGGDDAPGAARSLPDPNAIYGARRGAKENRR